MKREMKLHEPSKVRNFVLSDRFWRMNPFLGVMRYYRWFWLETRSEICSSLCTIQYIGIMGGCGLRLLLSIRQCLSSGGIRPALS